MRELLLTGAALVGVVCLLAATASFVLHIRPLIFRSGSMGPVIGTGALGLARQVPAASLAVGDVVSVPNARGVRITHRIRTVDVNGGVATLVLQGDANRVPDPEPYVVTHADRLFFHVNDLGYAIAWLGHRSVVFGGGVLVGVLGGYAFRRPGAPGQQGAAQQPTQLPAGGRKPRRGPPPPLTSALAAAVLAGSGLLLAPHATGTLAAFTDAGRAVSGDLTTRYWRCDSAITADAPRIYYKLNETGATTAAADSSGNARPGTYSGTLTKGVTSPCTRDGGTAVTFTGTNSYVSFGTSLSTPTAITLEAWFKTTATTATGLIVGFGAAATGASGTTDRVIYMATGGQIVFGVNTAAKTVVTSTGSYNNNAWHHVMATAGTAGLRLYVDGAQVGTSTSVATAAYGGFFRVGYDSLTGWTPSGGNGQFLGSIDEVAVYSATLTATNALDHYRAAT